MDLTKRLGFSSKLLDDVRTLLENNKVLTKETNKTNNVVANTVETKKSISESKNDPVVIDDKSLKNKKNETINEEVSKPLSNSDLHELSTEELEMRIIEYGNLAVMFQEDKKQDRAKMYLENVNNIASILSYRQALDKKKSN